MEYLIKTKFSFSNTLNNKQHHHSNPSNSKIYFVWVSNLTLTYYTCMSQWFFYRESVTITKLSLLQELLDLNVMYFQPQKSLVIRVVSYPSSSSSSSHKTISSGSVTEDFKLDSNSSTSSGKPPFSWASESSSSRGISFGSASATPKNQQHLVSKESLSTPKSSKVGDKTSYMTSIALQNCRFQIHHWSEKSNL